MSTVLGDVFKNQIQREKRKATSPEQPNTDKRMKYIELAKDINDAQQQKRAYGT